MIDELATLEENIHLGDSYYRARFKAASISRQSRPGQFVMVRICETGINPLLRRPFAIMNSVPPHIWIYYEVVGRGTKILADMKHPQKLSILGPLGNPFPEPQGKKILMIAGGRGIAPLYHCISRLSGDNRVSLLYGAQSIKTLHLLDELKLYPMDNLFLYTDDGTRGTKGLVTRDVATIINSHKFDMTFSCGPHNMLKDLHHKISSLGCENHVSLEAIMGCGFGICHSCVAQNSNHVYKKVCTDGPVFRLEEIQW